MRTIKEVQRADEVRVLAWGQKGDLSHIQFLNVCSGGTRN
jgi:hypothetical protein